MSRAFWYSSSSDMPGYWAARWSAMALCSFAKTVWSSSSPTHQLVVKPVSPKPSAFSGRRPRASSFSFPPL